MIQQVEAFPINLRVVIPVAVLSILVIVGVPLLGIYTIALDGLPKLAWSLPFWFACIALYLLPTLIAVTRKHPQSIPLAIVNMLLGWSVIGWIGALVWSLVSYRRI